MRKQDIQKRHTKIYLGVIGVIIITALCVWRCILPERALNQVGPHALLDTGFAIGLLGITLLVAMGLGWKIQRWLDLKGLTLSERVAFGLPTGLGILAYGVFVLGFLNLLNPWMIFFWLIGGGVWASKEAYEILCRILSAALRRFSALMHFNLAKKALLVAGILIFGFALAQALTPPYGYDSLMYHLQAPKLFLSAGHLQLLPDIWQANGPFTVEMLYTIGLAFGSDVFARLIHLTYALCLMVATYGLGRRFIGNRGSWIATLLLLGVPILPFWASLAYADMAWAAYEILGIYAFLLWREKRQTRWLVLSGLMLGWAAGCKYLALGTVIVIGGGILWQSRSTKWKGIASHSLFFGLPAFLVASPWYLKNWLWAGNPLYPFVFGGPGWDTQRLDLLMSYLQSFGAGRSITDYALLPVNLYVQNTSFGTFGIGIEILGFLIPLALLYPIARSHLRIDSIAIITILRFLIWSVGSQQTRFLLPVLPTLSLLASYSLLRLSDALKRRRLVSKLVIAIPISMGLLATLVLQIFFYQMFRPVGVIRGNESKDRFLRRAVAEYPAFRFIHDTLPPNDRVFMMVEGPGYYCDARCLPDTEPSAWTNLVFPELNISFTAERLHELGVTHLLLKLDGVTALSKLDREHDRAMTFFEKDFKPACLQEVYRDQHIQIFEIVCTPPDQTADASPAE